VAVVDPREMDTLRAPWSSSSGSGRSRVAGIGAVKTRRWAFVTLKVRCTGRRRGRRQVRMRSREGKRQPVPVFEVRVTVPLSG